MEYDQVQIRQLLAMIDDGNRPKNPKAYDKDSTGLRKTVSAFGIVGKFKCSSQKLWFVHLQSHMHKSFTK